MGRSLSTLGISGHDRVAIVLRNGPEMATAFLSVAAWVTSAPLNPAYRAGEFDFYLGDLNAKALIIEAGTDSPARDVARAWGISIIELSPLPDAAGLFTLTLPHAEKPTPPLLRPTPHDIALVLHTSGTTSRPKMVPLTHHNLICSARNVVTTLQLQPTECCLNVMPLFHIHGLVAAVLASITAGGSVVCTPGFDANAFFRWIEMFRPSWYTAVPTIHQSVLAVAADQQAVLQQHPLRFLRTSSAAMPSSVMEQLEQVFQAPVIEAYGMTEASHQMTSNPHLSAPRKPRSVGIASQTAVAIADISTNQLLPQGAVGEVVICGESVTHGYANNPEANAKAFFDGWFRTGDQGYLDADGYLFLQGRLKEIVNRGGEKIAPLEVDEALMAFPEVHQAVAFAVPHPTLGEDLAAAVVLKPGANVTPEMLREYLFSHVADFKVPSQILLVDAIPKGATGKLQRLGLAKPLAAKLQSGYVAPRNTTEQAIADIVAEVLRRERVGIEENFFTIGGDSLKGTQVASRLANRFGVNLPNVVVFRRPTVAQLAIEITELTEQSHLDDGMQDLLDELQGLSAEEIEQLLQDAAMSYSNSNDVNPPP